MSLIGWIALSFLALSVALSAYVWFATRRSATRRSDLIANFVTAAFIAFAVFGAEYLVDERRERTARQEELEALVAREADLSGVDLAHEDLSGLFLRGKTFRSADLRRTKLERTLLDGAHFNEARLDHARLGSASLRGAHLPLADLSDAHLENADLTGADLRFAVLRDAHLDDATLFGANLFGADLRGATLPGAVLIDASVRGANLTGVPVDSASTSGLEFDYLTRWSIRVCPPRKPSCRLGGRNLLAAFDQQAESDAALGGWKRTATADQITFDAPSGDAQLTARKTNWTGSASGFARNVRQRVRRLTDYRELDALRRLTIEGGGPAFQMVFDWRPVAALPVTVIHVYYVESRTAYEFTATARGADFLQLRKTFDHLFAELSEPGT